MLSRKLLGSIAVGVLSVALVPATWARTHSRLASQTTASKQPASHSATARPVTIIATKTPTHHLTSSHVATRKVASKTPASHKTLSRKTTSHKLVSHQTAHSTLASHQTAHSKLASHRTTSGKLASKSVVSHKTLPAHSTKLASSKMTSARRPVTSAKLAKKTQTT